MARSKTTNAKRGTRKRRGQSEDMTGADEGSVEVRTVGIGDNSEMDLPKPDDWDYHFRTIKGMAEKSATAASLLRHAKAAAKKAKIDMDAMALCLKEDKNPDPVKLKRYVDQLSLGLAQSGSTLRIISHDTLLGDANEAAYKRGFDDGENGRTANNRYPDASDLAEAYAKGWRHGTSKNLGLTPEESDAAIADHGDDTPAQTDIEDFADNEPCAVTTDIGDIPAHLDRRPKKAA